MYANVIKSCRNVVAIADKELLGKIFEEGNFQLHIKESFYRQESSKERSKEEIKKMIEEESNEDATFNLVGKKTIKIALEKGIISKEFVKEIKGIPYSMVLL